MSAPADAASRERVVRHFDRTAFVEAAAGTGKTHSTIERVVHGVATGATHLREVAAITFTEAAAAELRERLRLGLEQAAEARGATAERDRCRAALAEVDDAAVSTLHAFARRMLAEHPLEAGLPPTFDVLDDVTGSAAFDEAWQGFVDDLLDDPGLEPALLRGLALGLRLDGLRELALALHRHWDRLEGSRVPEAQEVAVVLEPVLAPLRQACALGADACTGDTDRLRLHLEEQAAGAERLAGARDDVDVLTMLRGVRFEAGNRGTQANWPDGSKDEVVRLLREAQAAADDLLDRVRASILTVLLARLSAFVLGAAAGRRRAGRLEYHDLLVLARDLLRDRPDVRGSLRARWRHLCIDEFQDTDPLQAELAELLAPAAEGRLFLVGDPQQSIYRFRRADMGLYHRVRDALSAHVERLTTNFRSEPSVLAWVNAVFPEVMVEEPGVQPAYVPMDPHRPEAGGGPRVAYVGGPAAQPVGAVRGVEAAEVAAVARAAHDEGWPVHDRDGWRPARFRDVAVLLPTRRSLPALQRALAAGGVPYRIAARSLLLATQEVRDLVNLLRALDDPTDEIALVAALRSPALACRDDELLEFRRQGGTWSYLAEPPGGLPAGHPVTAGLAELASLHDRRPWLAVSELVETVVRERHLLELAVAEARPRDHWRRIHYVAELARAFTDGGGSTLRGFLDWLERQAEEGASVEEVIVEEGDDDAVRILTIHGAKGLEFPVVVLSGLNAVDSFTPPQALWSDDGTVAARLGEFVTPGFAGLAQVERAAEEAERIRLLYVAATRARDHLVVSLHHKADTACHAARLLAACPPDSPLWRRLDPPTPSRVIPPSEARVSDARTVPDADAWAAHRAEQLDRLARAPVVAATALAGDGPEDGGAGDGGTEPPPWRRGRAGTAVGRAVHAVLQVVDLATGEGLDTLAQAQAAAEGVPDRAADVARAARAALASDAVRAAVASGRFWREVYVGAEIGGTVVEGFVDLLVEGRDGLVVVDYKTDRLPGGTAELADRYRLQGAAYAAALEASLGRPVAGCTFVFVGGGRAVEHDVTDLRAAVGEVVARLR